MANEPKVTVDVAQVEALGFDFRQMSEVGLERTAERGRQLLVEEVPKVTHNLEQGVQEPDINLVTLTAELAVSARSGRVGIEGALLHEASGRTKEISLRPRPAYDYAQAVARGTGVYAQDNDFIGPHSYIAPRSAQALLIPISGPPPSLNGKPQAYITSGGQVYIVRRYSKGMKANPYDVRAAQRLETEVDAIWDRVAKAFADQEKEF